MTTKVQIDLYGKTLEIETGKFAWQANGAVTVRYGDTLLLATACMASVPKEGADFLPLTIEVAEKFYAVGRLPGGFFKREARPSSDAILAARLCDRPLRPLFPKWYHHDTQVIITVLSSDTEAPYAALGIIGASAALAISDIPFDDPIGASVVGMIDDELIVNPSYEQLTRSKLDLTVAGTGSNVMMVEAGSYFASEQQMLDALQLAQETNERVVDVIRDLQAKVGKTKLSPVDVSQDDLELEKTVKDKIGDQIKTILRNDSDKQERKSAIKQIGETVVADLPDNDAGKIAAIVSGVEKEEIRAAILDDNIRPDGRALDEIRALSSEVAILPRVHGSGLFTRGETQILNAVTLAPVNDKQRLDTFGIKTEKFFIHHYNFPPYSTGEAGRFGFTGRREIGHGALAERALSPIVPTEKEFPYTIRSVSEALSSNGSTSMASVCSGCLALMDAGVPIKEMVAGIAMGLITDTSGKYVVLTDIQGAEDHIGDMDFKVAGSRNGITALQMDIKVKGITFDIMRDALENAKDARMKVLEHMEQTLSQPRESVSKYAPSVLEFSIPSAKIGAVIGSGGANIRKMTEENEVTIDIGDGGEVIVSGASSEATQKVKKLIELITTDLEVGQKFTGKVTRILDFGAFVQVLPGKEGMVHISEFSEERVPSVESVVQVGDELDVMVVNVDMTGRVDLSVRAVSEVEKNGQEALKRFSNKRRNDDRPRGGGGYKGDDRPRGGGGYRGDDRPRSGGGYRGDDRPRSGGGYKGGSRDRYDRNSNDRNYGGPPRRNGGGSGSASGRKFGGRSRPRPPE